MTRNSINFNVITQSSRTEPEGSAKTRGKKWKLGQEMETFAKAFVHVAKMENAIKAKGWPLQIGVDEINIHPFLNSPRSKVGECI